MSKASDKPSGEGKPMGRYRKVEVRTWGDERFRALSAIPPCGQGLWLYLITGPHTGPIPGLFRAGRAGMAEELGWELEAFDKAFNEVLSQGMLKADLKARVMWIPNAIRCNRPESPNVVRGWAAEFDLIPECDLKREAYSRLREALCTVGESFVSAFDEAIRKPCFKSSPKTMPNQEQEQEQKQKQEQELAAQKALSVIGVPPPAAAAPATPRGTRLPADWALPKPWGDWALGEMAGWTAEVVRLEAAKFADFWHAKTGKDATKADWQATWRNWCRNARPRLPTLTATATETQQRNAEAKRLLGFNTQPDVIEG